VTALRVRLSRARALLTGRRDDARLSAEVDAHLDLLAGEHLRRGLPPSAAREAVSAVCSRSRKLRTADRGVS